MADIFDVIADATRRDILQILLDRYESDSTASHGGTSVSEIVTALGLSQPTVSKHLKVLREAGLVAVREEGQHRYYRLESSPLETVEDWLIPFLSVDFDVAGAIEVALTDQAKQMADAIGHAVADTTHRVTSAVQAVSKKLGK
ncbi:ArsR/SmtB family transcription factor [Mycetocola zhujimingii]|uniref:ArsR family transcriptional regulator n=1 Tax=Mycetocola zhujimingii TaxID=2079792 RepID=A0A2U1TAB5_9MICO|nr:metalloregulator ArsR/SmtB family transcription factor [Mycetocola zhujimingii]AWB85454.1 transcriptional regulator [Mycetocola zhujimingii]PWC04636.1 ArsR family transcriptional regulator [Mycetocola zhujimingii]